jgi:hypothetical protein
MPIVHCIRWREADADAKFARRIFGDGDECRRTRQRHLAHFILSSFPRGHAREKSHHPTQRVLPRPANIVIGRGCTGVVDRSGSCPARDRHEVIRDRARIADMRARRQQVRFVPIGELSEPIVVSSSSWDRCRSPREIVGPKIDCDGRQAQSHADPENRRMMDRSSVARSWLHSITARASSEGGTARPSAFTVLRSITTCTPIAERPSPPLLDQLGAKTSVLDVGY